MQARTGSVFASVLSVSLVLLGPPATLQAGGVIPGDCNQDEALDLSDGVCLLGFLFLGAPRDLPCGEGRASDPANIGLADVNDDSSVNLSDAVYLFEFLFLGGPPPFQGIECINVEAAPRFVSRHSRWCSSYGRVRFRARWAST